MENTKSRICKDPDPIQFENYLCEKIQFKSMEDLENILNKIKKIKESGWPFPYNFIIGRKINKS